MRAHIEVVGRPIALLISIHVETIRSVVTSMLAGLDGRTVDGRGQRLFKAALDNILTTLDAIA